MSQADEPSTAGEDYAERLTTLQGKRWKQVLHVQAPWQWHIRSLKLGRTLDVGCGNGRNMVSLDRSSVGVDHNPYSIQAARDAGFDAYTGEEFFASADLTTPHGFDSMLVAHVLEHLQPEEMIPVVSMYLPLIKPGGRIVWITPQERGYASDATHLTFVDHSYHRRLAHELGLEVGRQYSFPFPRPVGKFFTYNEFVTVLRVPAESRA